MGLDSFWKMPEGEDLPVFEPPLRLCGGMFSGDGNPSTGECLDGKVRTTASFRGKVYAQIIEDVTDGVEGLYTEEQDNDHVTAIARALEKHKPTKQKLKDWDIEPDEYKDLVRMFRGYADAGASLQGWW